MRKFGVFILTAALFVCVMTGCPDNNDDKETPSSMTFVDGDIKEFTIYSNFDLTVEFLQEVEIIPPYSFKEGDTISAKITGADAWDKNFTGVVEQMTTKNPDIAGILKSMGITAEITLTYDKDENGKITATVSTKDDYGDMSDKIIGGTYTKK